MSFTHDSCMVRFVLHPELYKPISSSSIHYISGHFLLVGLVNNTNYKVISLINNEVENTAAKPTSGFYSGTVAEVFAFVHFTVRKSTYVQNPAKRAAVKMRCFCYIPKFLYLKSI